MVKKLEKDLFDIDSSNSSNNYISITDSGMEIAEKILDRHNTLTAFFISIGVDKETAKEDACKIEHDISAETFNALCKYIDKNKTN